MKLVIKRSEFSKLLNYVDQAVPAKSAEAQFLNFLLTCGEDELSIIASDGVISAKAVQTMKDANGNDVILNMEPGAIQIPAKVLVDIVSKLADDTVTLTIVDSNLLNISDGSSQFNLVTKAAQEYPDVDLNIPEENQGFKVSIKDLKKLYNATSYAVATRGPKELFFGINIRAFEGKLYFLATDSYRMARYAVPEADQDAQFSFTCPVKALNMVTNMDEASEVTIYFDEQRALFVSNQITLSTRLLRGDFPSADRLITTGAPYEVKVNTSEFLNAADCVKIMSSAEDKNSQVRLTISSENGVTLTARSANYGNSTVPLKKAEVTMPEGESIFEIGFNIDFATAAVKALDSEKFIFEFSSPTRMFMVKSDDVENIQIITPIRMNTFSN